MALDIVSYCITGNPIDNGGIIVNAPRGQTGLASNFAGSLELTKEGDIELKQTMLFGNLFIRKK